MDVSFAVGNDGIAYQYEMETGVLLESVTIPKLVSVLRENRNMSPQYWSPDVFTVSERTIGSHCGHDSRRFASCED